MRWVSGLVVLSLAAVAHAQPSPPPDPAATGKQHAAAAEAKAKAGDLLGAAASYRSAFAADPRPEYQCNVGVAYYKATELPRAQFFLTECVLQGASLDATFLGKLRTVQTAVEGKLRAGEFTPVGVVVEPAGAKVQIGSWAADEGFVGARALWLPWGTHALTVTAEGYEPQTVTLPLATRERVDAKITLTRTPPPPEDPPADPPPPVDVPPADPPPPVVERAPLPALERPFPTAAVVASSAAVVSAGFATAAYVVALRRADEAGQFLATEARFETLRDRAFAWRNGALVGAGVAAVAGGVAAYLWIKRSGTEPTTVSAAPIAGGAVAWLSGRF